ncbi:hypothetical protein NDU88_006093 [Pleurodeles waltl]|uniref:Uncharacterized protein n=1 Tax=Pleurodeles waltl TaxID=8319 RepID=A0AAV7NPC7_PLEWA|nr:hypothetical protein NDU88_006093 [Pleurodeles waltl]
MRCEHICDGGRICSGSVVAPEKGRAHGPCAAGGPSCLAPREEGSAEGRGRSDGLLAAVSGSEARPGEEAGAGWGRASPGKQGRVVFTPAGSCKASLAFQGKGRGGAGSGKARGCEDDAGAPQRVGGPRTSRAVRTCPGQDRDSWVQGGGVGGTEHVGEAEDLNLQQGMGSPSWEGEGGTFSERDGEFDPLVPISRKWPSILEWSATESEGEEAEDVGDAQGGASPIPIASAEPRARESVAGGESQPSTGGSATLARRAGKATGGWPKLITRIDGVEAFGCGRSRGAVWRQGFCTRQRRRFVGAASGPIGVQPVVTMRRTVRTTVGELPRRAQEVLGHGNELWREDDCILDYDETSLEEGELVDDGDEEIWWEQGGVGPANALSQSWHGV